LFPATKERIHVQTLERPAPGSVSEGLELHQLLEGLHDWEPWSLARRFVKRSLDVIVSMAMLLVLLPVLAAVALAIKFDSPGPVLYRQGRCGKGNRCFDVLKFRSMRTNADELLYELRSRNESDGLLFKIKDDPRITRVGTFIRRYSLDELPQLVNVLKGDMSLVGPRPLPVKPEDFGQLDGRRHAVRPGLTCHWQVSGRSKLSYQQMVALDLAYIHESSTWTDITLLFRTVPVVLTGSGAY
jgi:lipopolysaccharide/colanic/teichoic acid biosynthesis glycosyltransferase